MSARLLLLVIAAGCGRLGFDPSAGGDAGGDAHGDGGPLPPGAAWREVAVGATYACAIAVEGSLWCWGDNGEAQGGSPTRDVPLAVTRIDGSLDWTHVSASRFHTCALKADGSLWCWGNDIVGALGDGDPGALGITPQQVGTSRDWAEVEVGEHLTCGIRTDGTLWCWGANRYGQLGLGLPLTTTLSVPTQVGTAADWYGLQVAPDSVCALRAGGAGWCWGENYSGHVGNGVFAASQDVPARAIPSIAFAHLQIGEDHACGIDLQARLWCWGLNSEGQLGDGTQVTRGDAVQVSPGAAWTSVAIGRRHTCATQVDDTLWCWGDAAIGQIGIEQDAPAVTPRLVPSAARSVAAEFEHTCWVSPDGGLACMGRTGSGQNPALRPSTPEFRHVDDGWAQVALGEVHGCGRRIDGTTACWGAATIGDGGNQPRQRPSTVPGAYSAIAVGATFALALGTDGSLWTWGFLGGQQDTPTRVGTSASWRSISGTSRHACAIDTSDALYCWGGNATGQLGDGTTVSRPDPTLIPGAWKAVGAGTDHSCAITTGSGIACWGSNTFAQLGDGSTTPSLVPVPLITPALDWVDIAASDYSTCARASTGEIYCWGFNGQGQLANGQGTTPSPMPATGFTDWTSLSAGDEHACGVRAGALWCWGHRNEMAADLLAPMAFGAFVAYGGGAHVGCALDAAGGRSCWGIDVDGQFGDGNAWTPTPWPIIRP